MDDDYIDETGTISMWRLFARPRYRADDPRYLSPEMIDRIARYRLAQMEREVAQNLACLASAGGRFSSPDDEHDRS